MQNVSELTNCLCCNGSSLKLILDLNEQPLANSFRKSTEGEELVFPLKLNFCKDCSHLQLSHAVNPDLLFKNYLYVSGTTKTLKEYFDWFAKYSLTFFKKAPNTVLDIACNDGTQLDSWKSLGLTTYGIDPAKNLHSISSSNHEVVCDYFTEKYIEYYKSKNLDIINAQNVFAHIKYPLKFLQQCKAIMKDNTVLFIQTSQSEMIKNNEFDTIYHEHLSFFNTNSMNTLAKRAGLYLTDVIKTDIHGTSYVFVFKLKDTIGNLNKVLNSEKDFGLQDYNTYVKYAEKCYKTVNDLKKLIQNYQAKNYTVCGYGAAAKGMTLINFAKLNLDFIIDDNPLKQGLFTPGRNIPIVPIDYLSSIDTSNIIFIPLAWNFFKEIKNRIKAKRNEKNNDLFIKYFPEISIET